MRECTHTQLPLGTGPLGTEPLGTDRAKGLSVDPFEPPCPPPLPTARKGLLVLRTPLGSDLS